MPETIRERNSAKSFEDVPSSDIDEGRMAAAISLGRAANIADLADLGPVIGDRDSGQPVAEAHDLHVIEHVPEGSLIKVIDESSEQEEILVKAS